MIHPSGESAITTCFSLKKPFLAKVTQPLEGKLIENVRCWVNSLRKLKLNTSSPKEHLKWNKIEQ